MCNLTIWKFPLNVVDVQSVDMPQGARILAAQAQGEHPTLWALVSPDAPKVSRRVRIYGTGHTVFPNELTGFAFVGTVQTHGGALAWHVFDGGEAP